MNAIAPEAPAAESPSAIRQGALMAILLSVLLAVLDYAVANIALPTIGADLHASASVSIWVVNAYQLVNCMLLLPLAAFAERIGAKKVCLGGLAVLMAGSLLCALSHHIATLAFARGVQGAGGAAIMAVNTALIRMVCPPARLGHCLALNSLTTALSVALGPSVAAAILYCTGSWRWLFLFNLPAGALVFALCKARLPATPPLQRMIDPLSIVLNMAAFCLILTGSDFVARNEWASGGTILVLLGAVAGGLLLIRQKEHASPLLPVDLLARPAFSVGVMTCFLGYTAANFFMISIPFSLTGLFGRSPVATGLLITAWPGAMVLTGPLVARLSDRIPAGTLSSLGLAINGFGFLMVRMTPLDAGGFDIMWRFALAGMGFAMFVSPNNRAIVLAAPHDRNASASGMIALARIMGQTCGATLVAMIMARVADRPTLLCLDYAAAVAWSAALLSLSRKMKRRLPCSFPAA